MTGVDFESAIPEVLKLAFKGPVITNIGISG
jgi:hypothetical protein